MTEHFPWLWIRDRQHPELERRLELGRGLQDWEQRIIKGLRGKMLFVWVFVCVHMCTHTHT